jgi:hypothetical protein
MPTPTPFKHQIPDDLLGLTKRKLENGRLLDQLQNMVWEGESFKSGLV